MSAINIGDQYERLTVVERLPPEMGVPTRYRCVCNCGTETIVRASKLKSGNTRSCGCLARELVVARQTKHGHAKNGDTSRTYAAYRGMIHRCVKTTRKVGKNYKDRGITVCERWMSYENFLADMGECPEGLTLERKEVNGNYEPSNCIWATMKVQQNNRRNNHRIEFEGKNLTVSQWAELRGWGSHVIFSRLRAGWSEADALTRPVVKQKNAWRP